MKGSGSPWLKQWKPALLPCRRVQFSTELEGMLMAMGEQAWREPHLLACAPCRYLISAGSSEKEQLISWPRSIPRHFKGAGSSSTIKPNILHHAVSFQEVENFQILQKTQPGLENGNATSSILHIEHKVVKILSAPYISCALKIQISLNNKGKKQHLLACSKNSLSRRKQKITGVCTEDKAGCSSPASVYPFALRMIENDHLHSSVWSKILNSSSVLPLTGNNFFFKRIFFIEILQLNSKYTYRGYHCAKKKTPKNPFGFLFSPSKLGEQS